MLGGFSPTPSPPPPAKLETHVANVQFQTPKAVNFTRVVPLSIELQLFKKRNRKGFKLIPIKLLRNLSSTSIIGHKLVPIGPLHKERPWRENHITIRLLKQITYYNKGA